MEELSFLEKLHNLQDTYGYIPEREISNLAEEADISRAKVFGVISFYSMFYTEPTGKYIVRICDSLSCYVNDSEDLVKAVQDYLEIEDGETSKDKKFSLEVVECLGHCGEGPVMMINNKTFTQLNEKKALNILKECK
ncbi:NADH-quinone oxidoreductase subunit NuoE family protein [Fuchsiella alkaliacetigena]|uniref:NADH-quinone oxidoreductase subunit NuoE family protein n=1 Tax=Fuchsiella alkaliacetigena TaxID=957042 RepID=UPI00200A765A|nr:NAD(P)H-dependent oxidoreductase subunit E [Fuchsiella alkaliacetigena]MCK8825749.1 NAD(P)H-dependent oxidoreductase subunit E [Fuchsiella alkaliacetigena]